MADQYKVAVQSNSPKPAMMVADPFFYNNCNGGQNTTGACANAAASWNK